MSRRILTAGLLLVMTAAGLSASASAQPSAPAVLLQGTFQMSGTVTVAHNVRGEHRGQVVARTWTFTPQCPGAPCSTVQLVRSRATGTDTLTLQWTPAGTYVGSGLFYAPLRCSGRIYPQGEGIPFRIKVRVTANNGSTATAIRATYVNATRTNTTPCVGILGHDSARYVGQLAAG